MVKLPRGWAETTAAQQETRSTARPPHIGRLNRENHARLPIEKCLLRIISGVKLKLATDLHGSVGSEFVGVLWLIWFPECMDAFSLPVLSLQAGPASRRTAD